MNFTLVSHFHNEEVLLPAWVARHQPLFDRMILIDHQSTDESRDIIEAIAPEAIVIPSKLTEFDAWQNDLEVMEIERQYYKAPQMTLVLNTTESIVSEDFQAAMLDHYNTSELIDAWGIGSIILVDKGGIPSGTWGFKDPGHIRRKRYAHCASDGNYHLGRHGTNLYSEDIENVHILYSAFSPWPEVKNRKLQIQKRLSAHNVQSGLGFEHIQTSESLDTKYQEYLALSGGLSNIGLYNDSFV
mgnify:CR=1 FL=1